MLDDQPLGEYPELSPGIFFHPYLLLMDDKLSWVYP